MGDGKAACLRLRARIEADRSCREGSAVRVRHDLPAMLRIGMQAGRPSIMSKCSCRQPVAQPKENASLKLAFDGWALRRNNTPHETCIRDGALRGPKIQHRGDCGRGARYSLGHLARS